MSYEITPVFYGTGMTIDRDKFADPGCLGIAGFAQLEREFVAVARHPSSASFVDISDWHEFNTRDHAIAMLRRAGVGADGTGTARVMGHDRGKENSPG